MRPMPRAVPAAVVFGLMTVLTVRPGARQSVTPPLTVERVELAVDRLMAHRHFPAVPTMVASDGDHAILTAAIHSPDAAIRAVAVRANGRLEDPGNVPALMAFLQDSNRDVRVEAGNAIALSLRRAPASVAVPVVEALLPRVANSAEAEAWMYDTLGRLPYARADADRVEAALVGAAERPSGAEVAERAIVNLIARDRARPVATETQVFLENRARGADTWPVRLQAWRALQLIFASSGVPAGAEPADLIASGIRYRCTLSPDCGWQIREIAIDLADPHDATLAAAIAAARRDASVNVRLAALRRQARLFAETKQCGPLVATVADASESTIVHLEAITLLDPRCVDHDAVVSRLGAMTAVLARPAKGAPDWHEPARALEALAKFDETAARRALAAASASAVWQVRAAAARAATTLKDEATLVGLARDRASNVATEAIKGLTTLKSPQATTMSLAVLEAPASDYQLVRQAAETLRGDAPDRAEVAPLLSALARLTAEGKDTSRDPRSSILNRLKALAMQKDANGASWVPAADPALAGLPTDFDPEIAALAAAVMGVATGTTPAVRPAERPIDQPTEAELREAPGSATVTLVGGERFQMSLLRGEAPLAVARFAKLVRAGYYTGLTFHRVEPLFVVQGGSPHANEYGGADRFWRDEIGLEHNTAGAVGLSTRGRDTADGQIYIDLTDQYRLDFTYTVFARVTDLAVVTRILEGAEIKDIKLGK